MKRWGVVLCAAAACLLASQAQAAFRVVKAPWGQCVIWDYGPAKPWTPVTIMSKPKPTFDRALKSHAWLVAHKYCAW